MQQYNSQLRMKDLFMNPALAGVFPQFTPGAKQKNVYSFAETEEKVLKYLASALNGTITGAGELVVRGKQQTVLSRVRQLQPLIESFFNNIPKVAAALRKNAPLYLPYAARKQLEDIKTPAGKIKALRAVMDNFQYNTDLGALNSVKHERPEQFRKNKSAWERKVGYRGRLKFV